MLTHPTHDRLIALGLVGMAKAFEEQRQQPNVASLTFEERLGLLVDREALERENKRLVTRLRLANFSRVTSRLLSRSTASRSTSRPSRSSNVSAATAGCARCSSNALAMPTRPRAISRSCVGCGSMYHSSVFFSPALFLRVPPLAGLPGHAIIRELLSGSSHAHGCWRAGSAIRPACSVWRRLDRARSAGST